MAITVTDESRDYIGSGSDVGRHLAFSNLNVKVFTITFDSVYPAAGESFDPTNYGFTKTIAVLPIVSGSDSTGATGAYVVGYDHTTEKLQVFGGASAASGELAVLDKADLSSVKARVLVIGLV